MLWPSRSLAAAAPSVSGQGFSVPVVYKKLPNGLRVVISENHAAPVVVVEVMYRIGFRIEPQNRTGFAHLFEHMMFQGSETRRQVRARPHRQRERRHAERVDAVRPHQLLRGDAVERARARDVARGRPDAVAEDHARERSRTSRTWSAKKCGSTCSTSRTARSSGSACRRRRTRTGTTPTISTATCPTSQAATLDDVKKFFDTYYAPNNAVLVVVRRHDAGRGDEAGREALRRHPVAPAAAAARHQGAAADRREDRSPRATSSRARRRSRSAITCPIG